MVPVLIQNVGFCCVHKVTHCAGRVSANTRPHDTQKAGELGSNQFCVILVHLLCEWSPQVAEMHQYTILVGFHGDELLNSLYMPVGSVTIQLVPYNARSLNTERYAQVLRAHGPYLEWHNQHEKNSRPNQVDDSDNSLADTLVPVEEFVSLVKQALILGINSRLVQFQSP